MYYGEVTWAWKHTLTFKKETNFEKKNFEEKILDSVFPILPLEGTFGFPQKISAHSDQPFGWL